MASPGITRHDLATNHYVAVPDGQVLGPCSITHGKVYGAVGNFCKREVLNGMLSYVLQDIKLVNVFQLILRRATTRRLPVIASRLRHGNSCGSRNHPSRQHANIATSIATSIAAKVADAKRHGEELRGVERAAEVVIGSTALASSAPFTPRSCQLMTDHDRS